MKIYLARDNVQAGPYTLDELNTMLSTGEVALTDLMWHSGMSAWQTVGEMTGGQSYYQLTIVPPSTSQTRTVTQSTEQGDRSFGDNVDLYPHDNGQAKQENRRVTVAELYGQKPVDSAPASKPFNPSVFKPSTQTSQQNNAKSNTKSGTTLEYASVGSRFLAVMVNAGLFILTLLPLVMAFAQVFDANEFAKLGNDYNVIQAYSQELARKVPPFTVTVSNMLLLALLVVQSLLIGVRGQSLGELLAGIRVVDKDNYKLPKFGTLLMRTLVLLVLYLPGLMMFSGLPATVMLIVNYMGASKDKHKQGWHDKLTKTVVVKAHVSQLEKPNK